MRIAVFGDVHGNLPALKAVKKAIFQEKPDMTVFLGDLVLLGLFPKECIEELLSIDNLIALKGNADARFEKDNDPAVLNNPKARRLLPAYYFGRERLSSEDLRVLGNLPFSHSVQAKDMNIGFYHGTPCSYNDRIYEDYPNEYILNRFSGTNHNLAFLGHTHVRMRKSIPGLEIINPGAVGYSFDSNPATGWGMLTFNQGSFSYCQHVCEYNIESYCQELRKSNYPFKDELIEQLHTAEPNRGYVEHSPVL